MSPECSINRYYDPSTDEYLSIDPDVADTDQPYLFTNDDPLNAEDPLGLSWWNPVSWSTKTWENIAAVGAVVAVFPIPGLDIVGGAVAVGAGSVAATENVKNGHYGAAALDVVGVGLSGLGLGAAFQGLHDAAAADVAAKDSGYLTPMLKSMAADKAADKAAASEKLVRIAAVTAVVSFVSSVKATGTKKK